MRKSEESKLPEKQKEVPFQQAQKSECAPINEKGVKHVINLDLSAWSGIKIPVQLHLWMKVL